MHVLLPAQTTVELHHCLANRHIATRRVALPKVLLAEGDQWADLRHLVVPVFITWHRTVEVLAHLLVSCACQYAGDEGAMQECLSRPVVLVARKVLDTHGDVDADEGIDPIGSRRMLVWAVCMKIAMRSIFTGRIVHAKDHQNLKLSKNK